MPPGGTGRPGPALPGCPRVVRVPVLLLAPGREQARPGRVRAVTELLAVRPGPISFADDSDDNVQAALACGWNAVRYRSLSDLDSVTG
jgi:hypothetical protein